MKLTHKQKRVLEQLQKAKRIVYGVIWYIDTGAAKFNLKIVDGRTCNAFVRRGVLVQLPGSETAYELAEEYRIAPVASQEAP